MDNKKIYTTRSPRDYLALGIIWGVLAMLILLEPDFGLFVELSFCFLILVFVSGFPTYPFVCFFGIFISVLVIFIYTSNYRIIRFLAFFDPYFYYKTSGYQVIQSLISFSNGGLLGAGIGAGTQKLFYLPEVHTDYIFAVIAEETGFFGVFTIATMYLFLFSLCLRISRRSTDLFGALFSFGAGISLTLSAFFNMGVCLKLLPPTGEALPFISYGRSSMVSNIITMGIVYKISNVKKRNQNN
jgi:cell division protein FtsW